MSSMEKTINERIKEVRELKGMSQEALGKELGIGRSAISRIESGKNALTESNLRLLCDCLGVNRKWLLTGDGPMLTAAPSSTLDALAKEYNLRLKDYVLIERLVTLDEKGRDGIFRFMMDVVQNAMDCDANPDAYVFPRGGVESAEASYEESLGFAPIEESSVSNTTGGTASEKESVAND